LEDVVDQLPAHLTGADLYSLCSDAMLKSLERNIRLIEQGHVMTEEDKMLTSMDFEKAAERLIPSVSIQDLISYQQLEKKIKQAT